MVTYWFQALPLTMMLLFLVTSLQSQGSTPQLLVHSQLYFWQPSQTITVINDAVISGDLTADNITGVTSIPTKWQLLILLQVH